MSTEIAWDKRLACVVLGVVLFIEQLHAMSDESFTATQQEWLRYEDDDISFSESFIFKDKNTVQAYTSVCKKIAGAAYIPGGISIFGVSFVARRQGDLEAILDMKERAGNILKDDIEVFE